MVIKEILAILIRLSGIPLFVREVLCQKQATVLMYHDPKPETFAKHLAYLSKHYRFISLDHLVEAIYSSDASKLPPKSVVITIDDGHAGNFHLLPLFRKYNLRPTLFVCSQIVGTTRRFWFMADPLKRDKAARERLKRLPHAERLARLKMAYGFDPKQAQAQRQALGTQELGEMAADVDFQAHTRFHPILTTCDDATCEREISGCRNDLEGILGQKPTHFCFPNGDYTAREIAMVKKAGYRSARTSDAGWNDINSDPYRLKAMDISDDASINRLVAQMCGAFQFLKYALRGRFDSTHPTITSDHNVGVNHE